MTVSRVWLVALACWALVPATPRAQAQTLGELAIAFVERTGDPLYRGTPGYAGLYRPEHFSPYAAAELAIKDSAAAARARGLNLSLQRKSLTETEDAAGTLRTLAQAHGMQVAILDLPAEEMLQLANSMSDVPLILFNARHRDDGLRVKACRTRLLHTLPSWSMLHDALAQRLLELDWRRI